MSGSTNRIIALLEAFGSSTESALTAQEVVERSGLPQSTGYRILSELQELGLVHRGGDRQLVANFTFQRRLRSFSVEMESLAEACSTLCQTLKSAAEVVVLNGQNLLWHIVEQHPEQAIRLRAHSGFVRSAHELDAISRMALAHLPVEEMEKRWDTAAFFSAGIERKALEWREVRDTLAAVDTNDIQFDMMGNAKGVRRFAVAVHDTEANLACLLTIAEAAIPVRDEAAHIKQLREQLLAHKTQIEGHVQQSAALI